MSNLWDDIKKTIREGVDTVFEKTEELTKIGRIKVDILNIKRNVEKNFTELGGKVYHLVVDEKKTQIGNNKEVKEIIDSIKLLEKELEQKNVELEQVKAKENKNGTKAKPAAKKSATRATKTRATKSTPRKKAPAKKSTASRAKSSSKAAK